MMPVHAQSLSKQEQLHSLLGYVVRANHFLCVVEFMSVHESADVKTKKEWADTARLIGQVVERDALVDVIKDAIKASKSQGYESE